LKEFISRPILRGMVKKPEPLKPVTWNIYKFASKAVWLGTLEASDEATAMEKAAAEFKVSTNKADGDTATTVLLIAHYDRHSSFSKRLRL
jgi:hypothetical protein